MDFDYSVVYSPRRKTMQLIVERDRSIVVRAPEGTSEEVIQQLVDDKKFWLYQKVHHKQKYPQHQSQKEFVSGESFMYLGKNYRLEITDDPQTGLYFRNRFYLSHHYREQAQKLFKQWYKERAFAKLPSRIKGYAQSLGVTYNQLLVSEMKYRWASCTVKDNLNFNWRIMKAPLFVVDYLIVHELAHLLEANHTPRFWNIVSVQLPNYLQAKNWLRDNGHLLEE